MKMLMFGLSAFVLVSVMGYTQKVTPEKVPAPVKQAFAKKFPAATDVKFEMGKKDYEINFKFKGVEMSANFDAAGRWMETETDIKESDLPEEVTASVAKNFAGYKVSNVSRLETQDKGLNYELNLKNDKQGYEVLFTPKGDVIKKHPLSKEEMKK